MSDETTRTLERRRAEHALAAVQVIESKNIELQSSYRQWVRELAARIVGSGLGQTCATLLSTSKIDGDDAGEALYEDLSDWLTSSASEVPYSGEEDLLEAISSGDQSSYLHAQSESLAWVSWTKKFAQTLLHDSNR